MIKRIRYRIARAYHAWALRMLNREIRDTLQEQLEAEVSGDVTYVLNLESHLRCLTNERRARQAAIDRIPQRT